MAFAPHLLDIQGPPSLYDGAAFGAADEHAAKRGFEEPTSYGNNYRNKM